MGTVEELHAGQGQGAHSGLVLWPGDTRRTGFLQVERIKANPAGAETAGASYRRSIEKWERESKQSSSCRFPPAKRTRLRPRSGARSTWREYHGVLQRIQRPDRFQAGSIVPVEITIFQDNSFTFVTKTPPVADLLRKAANIEKGSAVPNRNKVAQLSREQIRRIAEVKFKDLNAKDVEGLRQ